MKNADNSLESESSESSGAGESALTEIITCAQLLQDSPCKKLPLTCSEAKNLRFDDWCEPCQARSVIDLLDDLINPTHG